MIVTIHQPEHMPWLGLLDKVSRADLFVVLDSVQFRKNYFQNRNRIRTSEGWSWITIPVQRPLHIPISEVSVFADDAQRERYLARLAASYRASDFIADHLPSLAALISGSDTHLARLNVRILRYLFDHLGIRTPLVLASELDLPSGLGGSDLLREIVKLTGGTTYLSGPSGRDYLDVEAFSQDDIHVDFHDFDHPIYRQLHEPFLPCMSVIDLLANEGPRSASILFGGEAPTMKPFATPPHGSRTRVPHRDDDR